MTSLNSRLTRKSTSRDISSSVRARSIAMLRTALPGYAAAICAGQASGAFGGVHGPPRQHVSHRWWHALILMPPVQDEIARAYMFSSVAVHGW